MLFVVQLRFVFSSWKYYFISLFQLLLHITITISLIYLCELAVRGFYTPKCVEECAPENTLEVGGVDKCNQDECSPSFELPIIHSPFTYHPVFFFIT